MTRSRGRRFKVGDWLVDPDLGALRRDGSAVRVRPRSMDVLARLALTPGQVVSRQEIFDSVWPGASVTDDVLTQAIAELRRAFLDDPRMPSYIETIPRRGYRLIAAVLVAPETNVAGGTSVRGLPVPAPDRVAVLPLRDLSSDRAPSFLASGMTEMLITELARLGVVRVISGSSSSRFAQDDRIAVREIAARLGVDAVLTGSVLAVGARLRVTVQMVDARSDTTVWAGCEEGPLRDVLALQANLAWAIAAEIGRQIGTNHAVRPVQTVGRTTNAEALQQYFRGRTLWHGRTSADLRSSLDAFDRAVREDPGFALAHAGVADAWSILAAHGIDAEAPTSAAPRATAAALRAIELDPARAQPWATRGFVSEFYLRRRDEAERFLRRAIELDPNYAPAHQWLSGVLLRSSRTSEAFEHGRIARIIDPLSGVIQVNDAQLLLHCDRADEAVEDLQRLRDIGLRFWQVDLVLAIALSQCGRAAHAIAAGRRARDASGDTAVAKAVLAHALARAGEVREAREIVSGLEFEARQRWVPPTLIAFVYLALGETELVIDRLGQAAETMDPYFVYFDSHALFDSVRTLRSGRAARMSRAYVPDKTPST